MTIILLHIQYGKVPRLYEASMMREDQLNGADTPCVGIHCVVRFTRNFTIKKVERERKTEGQLFVNERRRSERKNII